MAQPTYYLNIIGGTPQTHNRPLALSPNGRLIIPPPNTTLSIPQITFGPTPKTLIATPSPASGPEVYLALLGPAGKGLHRLSLTSSPTPPSGMVGLGTRWNAWNVVSDGLLFLRDEELVGRGMWVAYPIAGNEAKEEQGWEVWFLQPSGATVEDLKGSVMVNVEVVDAGAGKSGV